MKFKYIIDKVNGFRHRNNFVILDGRANSVTLSKGIYNHIMQKERTDYSVFVFRLSHRRTYGFCMRDDWEELRKSSTAFTQLQFNQEHKKVGFRSDLPSIIAILDDYNLPLNRMVRLTCIPRKSGKGEPYYEIMRPNLNSSTWQQDKK
ncbi:hypothetical protein JQM97_03495 [Prevotella hominis]|uniref:hypothetical protein n=1 Tax=Segatella hominis TaxID=2518605 RepID=UPI001F465D55|nr:hypothetical protein [Segatella hominis]MCF2590023.1 hypothetical protein [Segatella hominis]